MTRFSLLLAALLCLCLAGCAAYHVFPVEDRDAPPPVAPPPARVVNPELERELAILRHSGLYDLDARDDEAASILLAPLEKRLGCGTGYFVFLALVGLVPLVNADVYWFAYEVETPDGEVTRFREELHVARSLWLFNFLSRSHDADRKLGEALRAKAGAANSSAGVDEVRGAD